MTPEAAMKIALGAARRVAGRTYPNPSVGAAVFRGDRLLGRGATRPVGGPHAEVVALESAKRRFGVKSLRGASLAVTLEPAAGWGERVPVRTRSWRRVSAAYSSGIEIPTRMVRGRAFVACGERESRFSSACSRQPVASSTAVFRRCARSVDPL